MANSRDEMNAGWRYRVASVLGTVALTVGSVALANHLVGEGLLAVVPVLGTLPATGLGGEDLLLAVATTLLVVTVAVAPLFKPRPRRLLDTVMLSQKRVLLAVFALATVGYFDYTYRLPRATLLVTGALLLTFFPALTVAIRRQPTDATRAVIVGDDPHKMETILAATDLPVVGYVSSPGTAREHGNHTRGYTDGARGYTDGGVQRAVTETADLDRLDALGGIARLQDVLVEHDIDTAILAFSRPDRAAFFGTLDVCDRHGVRAMVHREHADTVLTTDLEGGDLATIDLDPWDLQERLAKRAFDFVFAAASLLVLAPVVAVVAAAIKLDSPGPVLYGQERTAEFGETFRVYKFRSMVPDAEAGTGATLSAEDAGGVDPRVTRVGRVLRKTHLDEIPQLWSILKGDMSVVGPRPERPELDSDIEQVVADWQRRWFVKPGLTGLAQINGATGYEPEEKLRFDLEYIRQRSLWVDLKIVIRQVWLVFEDTVEFVR